MKAIQIRDFGNTAAMQLMEVPEPHPGEGEVLVEVQAAGVNYADVLMRGSRYACQQPLPFVPGIEAAGIVLETGRGVSAWKLGQRVMGTALRTACGCYAEKAIMPSWLLMPLPEQFSFEEGAAIPEAFITAYLALRISGRLEKGESVLIHAAAGGVGTAAVQLACAMGAQVLATASSDEKLQKVRALGANVVINYTTQDFPTEVKKHTHGKCVDLVLDSVGGEISNKSLTCLQPLGRLVIYGISSGKIPSFNVLDLMQGMISVAGFGVGALTAFRPDIVRHAMHAVNELLLEGKIHPVVGRVFSLTEACAAHELIRSRSSFGKVILVPPNGHSGDNFRRSSL